MVRTLVFALAACCFPPIAISEASSMPKFRVRRAGPSDLESVVDVLLEAMPDDPAWVYRYPNRNKYPRDHRYFTELLLKFFIEPNNDDWTVMVVESPTGEDPAEWKVRAFGVWDTSYINLRKRPSHIPQDRESIMSSTLY
jgi:hypothetical protein